MKNKYIPQPLATGEVELSKELLELTELLAKKTHEVWSAQRLSKGWKYGPERNDRTKQHPGLVPYEELSEVEKAYDRNTALEALKAITLLGFEIRKK